MGKVERDTGNWLVTYGDLMTLLLVFFVLMYTLTPSISDGVFDQFIKHFQKSSGLFEAENINKEESQVSAEELSEMIEDRMEYWQAFSDFLESTEYSSEVDMEISTSGVKITLSDSLTFNSGSSVLLPMAETVLDGVASMIDDKVIEVEVQGHTDNVPVSKSSMYQSNWHLGAARAVSVVQFLQQRSTVKHDRFKASSFGEYSPLADNDTEEGRRKNRRVEIYLRDELLNNNKRSRADFWF